MAFIYWYEKTVTVSIEDCIKNAQHSPCAPNNTYVRVVRTSCIPWTEGRSNLQLDGSQFPFHMGVSGPYGCWFYRAEWSDILINVGSTFCDDRTNIWFELERRLYPKRSIKTADGLDLGWCDHALKLGYDTIQATNSWDGKTEVVVCNQDCDRELVTTGCPPRNVTLFNANTQETCRCDNTSVILNCGESYSNLHDCDIVPTFEQKKQFEYCAREN